MNVTAHPARFAAALSCAAILFAATDPAHAGRSCERHPPRADAIRSAMQLAERTAARLDASGARVVVLARVGQNLGEYGLRYSHLGLAYRDAQGRWRVVHKLNDCGSALSAVYRQGLGDFFLDDLYDYEAGFVVLAPATQDRLLTLVRDNVRLTQLHTPAYSMVAYAWATRYQQSNQWALETFAMAEDRGASTREGAQRWLKAHDYAPSELHIGPLKRIGSRMTAANIAFDDHPGEKRFAGRIETVTVDSVFAWLNRSGLGGTVQTVR